MMYIKRTHVGFIRLCQNLFPVGALSQTGRIVGSLNMVKVGSKPADTVGIGPASLFALF
jgi:hypothetical protein